MGAQPPAGTVTFLFAAVDRSSCWGVTPEAAATAIERHEAIVRDTSERHGGYVFATDDDVWGIAFATAVNAAEAAVELFARDKNCGRSARSDGSARVEFCARGTRPTQSLRNPDRCRYD